uniref:Hypothetical secreted protein 1384 n=1 Tax=Amblyomma variegatum TaxID=34610 RepID=F0J9V2_AMBVA|nr:TPA_inf: hypothetical secreted protein 1384 [Amblyomma variegatum]
MRSWWECLCSGFTGCFACVCVQIFLMPRECYTSKGNPMLPLASCCAALRIGCAAIAILTNCQLAI